MNIFLTKFNISIMKYKLLKTNVSSKAVVTCYVNYLLTNFVTNDKIAYKIVNVL